MAENQRLRDSEDLLKTKLESLNSIHDKRVEAFTTNIEELKTKHLCDTNSHVEEINHMKKELLSSNGKFATQYLTQSTRPAPTPDYCVPWI